MRQIPRKDTNHKEIVKVLKDCGITVWDAAHIGGGFPDLVISHKGKLMLLEIKDGSKPPSARKLTDDEAKFHAKFHGHCHVIESVDDILRLIGVEL
jgi:hypothetical protein